MNYWTCCFTNLVVLVPARCTAELFLAEPARESFGIQMFTDMPSHFWLVCPDSPTSAPIIHTHPPLGWGVLVKVHELPHEPVLLLSLGEGWGVGGLLGAIHQLNHPVTFHPQITQLPLTLLQLPPHLILLHTQPIKLSSQCSLLPDDVLAVLLHLTLFHPLYTHTVHLWMQEKTMLKFESIYI